MRLAADPAAVVRLVATEFDAVFYRRRYSDVAEAGVDPLEHFVFTGWRERRWPAEWFDTAYYLDTNPDVAGADINPFWHFLAAGRREGRMPRARPDAAAEQLARVLAEWTPEQTVPDAVAPEPGAAAPEPRQGSSWQDLRERIAASCHARNGLVVAVGHDDYVVAVGGTQIVTALEQQAFDRAGFGYLHAAPLDARLSLARQGPAALPLTLRLDGEPLGRTTWGGLRLALTGSELPKRRWLIIHSLLGHRPEDVARFLQDWPPERAVFWIHDYASLCDGLQLMRNDTFSCDAPPRDSMACRVCRHGPSRPALHARLHRLFHVASFDVLAPSSAALALWSRSADLPCRSTRVHPHVELHFAFRRPRRRAAGPPRLGFVGRPLFHKGWAFFAALIPWALRTARAELVHFATADALAPRDGLTVVRCAVSAAAPDATVRALVEHAIDAVLVLSPWPETFCLAAHEALAAGARVVCLAGSGHVAELVRRTGRGVILPDAAALLPFLDSPQARELLTAPWCASVTMRRSGASADLLSEMPAVAASPPELA